jgi:hypothetical protein
MFLHGNNINVKGIITIPYTEVLTRDERQYTGKHWRKHINAEVKKQNEVEEKIQRN